MIRRRKIFISGGAGFIATNLIERLVSDNQIVVYDNLARNSVKESKCCGHPNLRIIDADVLDA